MYIHNRYMDAHVMHLWHTAHLLDYARSIVQPYEIDLKITLKGTAEGLVVNVPRLRIAYNLIFL